MPDAVIVSAVRTPIGRYGGALAGVRAGRPRGDRGARRRSSARASPPATIEDVYLGCANQAGEDNRNVARMAVLLAGLPGSGRRRDRQPPVRVRACRRSSRPVTPWRRRRRPVRRRRRRVDDARAAGRCRSRSARSRAATATVYDTTLGWRFPNPRLEAMFPLESDGRDRRERRRALRRLARGSGRLRAAVQRRWAAAQEAGPLRRRAGAGRRARRSTSTRGRTRPREAGGAQARVPRGRQRHGRQLQRHQRRRRRAGVASEERARELGLQPLGRVPSPAPSPASTRA